MKRRFTILGCGSSGGVPRVAQGWGACDPDNPRNRRRRCAMLVEQTSDEGVTRVLVDASTRSRTTSQEVYYVAISRAQREARVYTDDLARLPAAITREHAKHAKHAALDLDRR